MLLRWKEGGDVLLTQDGLVAARFYQDGDRIEWRLTEVLDPIQETYGTVSIPRSARLAIEKAIRKLGHDILIG